MKRRRTLLVGGCCLLAILCGCPIHDHNMAIYFLPQYLMRSIFVSRSASSVGRYASEPYPGSRHSVRTLLTSLKLAVCSLKLGSLTPSLLRMRTTAGTRNKHHS
ncbi:hypothetical protein EV421DRAFT_1865315 [Armillaria borealis]|uniref:Secreted protein n=1 Tax=Armillaria borealis TaxID=47425 RepID=A0AA39IU95_9AGAR|nr:hypothetical protein EV421DRAFT_1865315 [Armillaria borealis]